MGKETVRAALADLATAPIAEKLRATLAFLRKVTREHDKVTADDVRALLALGITRAQIEDALNVGFAFNVITRLADTFEFEVGPHAAFEAGAKFPAEPRIQVILLFTATDAAVPAAVEDCNMTEAGETTRRDFIKQASGGAVAAAGAVAAEESAAARTPSAGPRRRAACLARTIASTSASSAAAAA